MVDAVDARLIACDAKNANHLTNRFAFPSISHFPNCFCPPHKTNKTNLHTAVVFKPPGFYFTNIDSYSCWKQRKWLFNSIELALKPLHLHHHHIPPSFHMISVCVCVSVCLPAYFTNVINYPLMFICSRYLVLHLYYIYTNICVLFQSSAQYR